MKTISSYMMHHSFLYAGGAPRRAVAALFSLRHSPEMLLYIYIEYCTLCVNIAVNIGLLLSFPLKTISNRLTAQNFVWNY